MDEPENHSIHRIETRSGIDPIDFALRQGTGSITGAGVKIGDQTALSLTAVWQAVNIYANALACLPLCVYRRKPGGGRELADDDNRHDILNHSPNDTMSAYKLRQAIAGHLFTRGNAYLEIVRNGLDEVTALVLLDPRWMTVEIDAKGRPHYLYKCPGRDAVEFDQLDIVHFSGLGYDGIRGYSPIQIGAEALGIARATENVSASLYANGLQINGAVQIPGPKLNDTQLDQYRREINREHQGSGKAGNVLLLTGGAEWVSASFTAHDAELIASRIFSISEIARIFNLPVTMLNDLSHASFSNIEEQYIQFYQLSLLPILESIEAELDFKLFSREERKQFYVEHDFQTFLRGNAAARSNYYRSLFAIGALTQNEIRAYENLNPVVGGDVCYVPLNMIATDDASQQVAQDINKPTEDKQPGEPSQVAPGDDKNDPLAPDQVAKDRSAKMVEDALKEGLQRFERQFWREARKHVATNKVLDWLDNGLMELESKTLRATERLWAAHRTLGGTDLDPREGVRSWLKIHRDELTGMVKSIPPDELQDAIGRKGNPK